LGHLSVSIAPSTLINGKEKLRALHRVAATGELDEEIPITKEESLKAIEVLFASPYLSLQANSARWTLGKALFFL